MLNGPRINRWQDVQDEVLRRIHSRTWKPGELLPTEVDLAAEFGCARATVNRALCSVADRGFLERRRKAGTRVVEHPVRKAIFEIPILREEVENQNKKYSYSLISSKLRRPPALVRARVKISSLVKCLHISAFHMADNKPFVYEDRWINVETMPGAAKMDFEAVSANEWLVKNASYADGTFAFYALRANATQARILDANVGEALLAVEVLTWYQGRSVTLVEFVYSPGYRLQTVM